MLVLLTIIVQALLAGLLAPIIARETGGQQISAGDAWRAAAPRLPALLRATLLVLLASVAPAAVVLAIIGLAALASAPPAALAIIAVPGGLLALVLTIWISTMLSLVTPVVVLEGTGPWHALARSWRLVWRSFWRVFGILLLAEIIVGVAGGILQLPFTFLASAAGGSGLSLGAVISVLGSIAAGTVTQPITAAVTVLLYVDRRMRREGLDLALRTAAGNGGPLDEAEFAAAWRPPAAAGATAPVPAASGPVPAGPVPLRPGARLRPAGPAPPWCPSARCLQPSVLPAAAVVNPGRMLSRPRASARAVRPGAAAGPGGAAPPVSRPAGQRLARAELSKSLYHPHQSLPQRILSMLNSLLGHLSQAGQSFPGGWWAVVALTALLVLAVTAVLGRRARSPGPAGGTASQAGAHRSMPAAEHRLRAGGLAAAGDYAGAILESVRAIGRELDERGVLDPRLGRTAAEIAGEAARALPAEAAALRDSARLFDDICYGDRPGTADGYAAVRELDTRIAAARPGLAAQAAGPAAQAAGAAGERGMTRATASPDAATRDHATREPAAGRPVAPAGPAGQPAGVPRRAGPGAARSWRAPLALAVLVLLGGIVIALLTPSPPTGGYLDPGNPGAQGTRALADLLAQRGQHVIRVDSVAAARDAAAGQAATLVITSPYLLSPGQLGALARLPGDLLVVEPDSAVLSVLGRDARPGTRRPHPAGRPAAAPRVTVAGAARTAAAPGCTLAAATVAGDAGMGGVLMRVSGAGGWRCYRVDGHPTLVRYAAGGRLVTLLGSGVPLTNRYLASGGDAALALNLLRGQPRIVWLVPSPPPLPAAGPKSLLQEIPGPAYLVAAASVHRGRAGRPVADPAARPAGRRAASGGGPRVGDGGRTRPPVPVAALPRPGGGGAARRGPAPDHRRAGAAAGRGARGGLRRDGRPDRPRPRRGAGHPVRAGPAGRRGARRAGPGYRRLEGEVRTQ